MKIINLGSVYSRVWAREVAFSAALCRMVDIVLLKFSFVETISKVKRQPSEWEKIIANEALTNN